MRAHADTRVPCAACAAVHQGRLFVAETGGRVFIFSLRRGAEPPADRTAPVCGAGSDAELQRLRLEQLLLLPAGLGGLCVDGHGRLLVANHTHGLLHVYQPMAR